MARNGSGFGHFKWGKFPWGHANFGEEVISRSFPYLEDEDGKTNELLYHYLLAIEDSVNRVRAEIDRIPEQVDFDQIRSDLIKYLGSTIDVEVDASEPEAFQRSLVANAIQFYQIKGTLNSYKIRGKISGFDVTINNLYRLADDLVPFFDPDDIFQIPPHSGRYFTTVSGGSVSGDDRLSGFNCDYCLTAFIKLNFEVVKAQPPAIIGEGNFFDRLSVKLRDIIPIHVRDVIYEITATISVSAGDNIVTISGEEITCTPTSWNFYYDQVPADYVPTGHQVMYVSGTASEETV